MVLKQVNNFFKNTSNTIHSATRMVLMAARCFGVFPVTGLTSMTPSNLNFTLKSSYTVFVILTVSGQFVLSGMSLVHLFQYGTGLRTIYKFVTNAAGTICTLIIIRLAKHWPKLVYEATIIEKSLPKYNNRNIRYTCKIIAAWIFLSALVEYILSIKFYSRFTEACYRGNSLIESYYMYTMPYADEYVGYSLWGFLILQAIYIQSIFTSNFTDVFIITISLYLSAFFEELNDLISLYKDKSPSIWNVLRVHYTRLTRLVKIVDDYVSSFILYSFGINMTIICIQLFKILRRDLAHETHHCDQEKLTATLTSIDRGAYFHFSTCFLIARAMITALFATKVHTVARSPLIALYEVPACCYNSEVRRFLDQIHSNTIALSGQHFFYVTRGMILTMVATVFTYELVLLQFSDKK